MKAKVIADFTDRLTMRDVYKVGDTYEGGAERIAELAAGGYVERPKPSTKQQKPKE